MASSIKWQHPERGHLGFQVVILGGFGVSEVIELAESKHCFGFV